MRQDKHSYNFGDFRVDSVERVLLRQGEPVALTQKLFDILLLLVENNGHVVEKDRLMNEIWPGTFVEEGNLTQNISVLRKALGDGARGHQYIQTVPRRGYRFVGRVDQILGDDGDELAIEEHSFSHIIVDMHENDVQTPVARAVSVAGPAMTGTATRMAVPGSETRRW